MKKKYKESIVKKVLQHDLQPVHFRNDNATAKPCNDQRGKEHDTARVAVSRQSN